MPIKRSPCNHPLRLWQCPSLGCSSQPQWGSSSHTSCPSCLPALEIDISSLFSMLVTSFRRSWFPTSCMTKVPSEDNFSCWEASGNCNYSEVSVRDQFSKLLSLVSRLCRRLRDEDARHSGHASPCCSRCNGVGLQACYDRTSLRRFKRRLVFQNETVFDVASTWFFNGKDEVLIDTSAVRDNPTQRSPRNPRIPQCGLVRCHESRRQGGAR